MRELRQDEVMKKGDVLIGKYGTKIIVDGLAGEKVSSLFHTARKNTKAFRPTKWENMKGNEKRVFIVILVSVAVAATLCIVTLITWIPW